MKLFKLLIFFPIIISFTFLKNKEIPITKIQLGKNLFFEKMLSLDSTVSCASCHKPEFAFADTAKFSKGIYNKPTLRNTPSVLNMLNRSAFFYDGRAKSLEEQALIPIENKNEMALPIDDAVKRLNENTFYKNAFIKIYNQKPNKKNLALTIAAYEKTLETVDSKFDDWTNNITKNWTASEERGRKLFIGDKAKCFNCHSAEDFTNDDFRNIGLFNAKNLNDSGRYIINKDINDIGKFKVPGLRNVAITAPYMHNGIFKTLAEVVEYYNDPKKIINNSINIDGDLTKPLGLTNQDKKDLVAFLNTLTDKKYIK